MTRPTSDDIRRVDRGDAKNTAEALRKQGFKFRDSTFWLDYKIATEAEPQFKSVMDDEPPGVIGSADTRRGHSDAKTFVFTSAQSNTKVHEAFLASLEMFCEHRGAELHIAQFTYNKGTHGRKSIKPGADQGGDTDSLWFDPRIAPYVSNHSIQITDDLVWCGELNILPTMKFPLSQFRTYTRHDSAIIPHAKMSMDSVPTMPGTDTRMLYTTGAVTQRNYVQKTAGQVADFHHVFGAMLVEIDDDGTWWARQLNAKDDGCFFDKTEYFTPDCVSIDCRMEAITHGDIHFAQRDTEVLKAMFLPDGILDKLNPKEQFLHDVIDFMSRNHHEIKDGHYWHKRQVNKEDRVEKEFDDLAGFLRLFATRDWSDTYVVTGNHDQFIEGWLRDLAVIRDPVNIKFWHELNWYCHSVIESGREPRPFAYALLDRMMDVKIKVLHEDDSHLICGSIEAGLHGHLGPNGARGSPKNLRTVGKANTGHTHSAGIVDGVYTAGTFSKLKMTYTKGLSSWSHSFIGTYANAKRAIFTIKNGKAWR